MLQDSDIIEEERERAHMERLAFFPTEFCHAYTEFHEQKPQRARFPKSQSDAQSEANETMVYSDDLRTVLEYDFTSMARWITFWLRTSIVHIAADAVTYNCSLQRDSFTWTRM